MATWRVIVQKQWFNVAGSIAVSSFKEILSNLRKSYLNFKEMCETGSESPASVVPVVTSSEAPSTHVNSRTNVF